MTECYVLALIKKFINRLTSILAEYQIREQEREQFREF